MTLKTQKRLASDVLKVGLNRVKFDESRLDDIKEAITKRDIRELIGDKAIMSKPVKGVSKFRARKLKVQKRKGRKQGKGSRKGKKTARLSKKEAWMVKVRTQRDLIKTLKKKGKLENKNYNLVYAKIKGGFFRSRRHIKLYLEEHKLIKNDV